MRMSVIAVYVSTYARHTRKPFVFKPRNYDPETRTIRKRALGEEDEDTVEKAVEGLAERIIYEDEERRAQDLVRSFGNSSLALYSVVFHRS